MSVEDNKAVVQAIYDHFNRHDLDRTVALVASDFELMDFAMGQTFRGPKGFRQWLQGHLTPLPDARVEVVSILAEGDWVATEHIGRGTHDGPLMTPAGEVPPTGRSVELKVAEFFRATQRQGATHAGLLRPGRSHAGIRTDGGGRASSREGVRRKGV